MPNRIDQLLRILCIVLAAIGLYQLARLTTAGDPLKNVTIPQVPTFSEPTNATPSTAQPSPPGPTIGPVPGIPAGPAPRMPGGPFPLPGPGGPNAAPLAADLPPEIQARIERIKQSEILGPIFRPLPMGLLGIAGKDAFIRTPTGQTGLMREGDELGGVKLLLISTNRVLVEHEGRQQELMIFSGFGSETLMHK